MFILYVVYIMYEHIIIKWKQLKKSFKKAF